MQLQLILLLTTAFSAEEQEPQIEPPEEIGPEATQSNEKSPEEKIDEYLKNLQEQSKKRIWDDKTHDGLCKGLHENEEFVNRCLEKIHEIGKESFESDYAKEAIRRFEEKHHEGYRFPKEAIISFYESATKQDLTTNPENHLVAKAISLIHDTELNLQELTSLAMAAAGITNKLEKIFSEILQALEIPDPNNEHRKKIADGYFELCLDDFPNDRIEHAIDYSMECVNFFKYTPREAQPLNEESCFCRSRSLLSMFEPPVLTKRDPLIILKYIKDNLIGLKLGFDYEQDLVQEICSKHYSEVMKQIKSQWKNEGKFWKGEEYLKDNFAVLDLEKASLKAIKPFDRRDLYAFLQVNRLQEKLMEPGKKKFKTWAKIYQEQYKKEKEEREKAKEREESAGAQVANAAEAQTDAEIPEPETAA